jgi:NhaA family Na+:H+ antiporter
MSDSAYARLYAGIREFLRMEAAGGIALGLAAVLALIASNSGLAGIYAVFLDLPVELRLGHLQIAKPLLFWINDGLMAIFFLLVGLEIKRELVEGELSSLRQAALPAIAAFGGSLVPALIYVLCNLTDPVALRGWAIPAATDIAFAVGVLSLLGARVPIGLKVFLLALAIFDDLGAIVVIAVFYTAKLSVISLLLAGAVLLVMLALNRLGVTRIAPYALLGIALWVCVLRSGVHATLAGVAMALAIPMRAAEGESPLRQLEHALHPWVAFLVVPLFGFANAGVSFAGMSASALTHGVPRHRRRSVHRQAARSLRRGLCQRATRGRTAAGRRQLDEPLWSRHPRRHRLHHEPVRRHARLGHERLRGAAPDRRAGRLAAVGRRGLRRAAVRRSRHGAHRGA